jgi:hypothetical protein
MSHRMMCGVPKMDNADGRMLETGLIRGNSAPPCRNAANGAEGRVLVIAAAARGALAQAAGS